MNVKQLKEAILDLPDDTEIMVEHNVGNDLIEESVQSVEVDYIEDDNGKYLTVFMKF